MSEPTNMKPEAPSLTYRGYEVTLIDGYFRVTGPGMIQTVTRSTDIVWVIDDHIATEAKKQAAKDAKARGQRPPKPQPPTFPRPALVAGGKEIRITSVKGDGRGSAQRVYGTYVVYEEGAGSWGPHQVAVVPEGKTVEEVRALFDRETGARLALGVMETVNPRIYRDFVREIPGTEGPTYFPLGLILDEDMKVRITSPLLPEARWDGIRDALEALTARAMRAMGYEEVNDGWLPVEQVADYQTLANEYLMARAAVRRTYGGKELDEFLKAMEAYRADLEEWKIGGQR